jgi:hypothetical protein
MNTNHNRRKFLKIASVSLALIPLVCANRQAVAATNAAIRSKLKYQDTPKDNMVCTTCLEFVAGKNKDALGKCNVIPGDDEISPNGYCISWNSM